MTKKEFSNIHEQVWNLLPWYINQTLSPDDDDMVEAHLSSCLVCRNELSQQRTLKSVVVSDQSSDTALKRSLSTLHQRIQNESYQPEPHWLSWLKESWRTVRETHFGIQTALLAQTAVIMVAIGFVLVDRPDQASEFQTLTSAPTPAKAAEMAFKVIFAEDLTIVGLQRLLEENDVTIKSGPSPAGAYELAINHAMTPEAVKNLLARLENHPEIRFVTNSN